MFIPVSTMKPAAAKRRVAVALFGLAGGPGSDSLGVNEALTIGQEIISPDRRFALRLGEDGDLALYRTGDGAAVWRLGRRDIARLTVQGDGNLVGYRADGSAAWSAQGTWTGRPSNVLVIQNDGNVVVYDGATARWSTNTWREGANAPAPGVPMSQTTPSPLPTPGSTAAPSCPGGMTFDAGRKLCVATAEYAAEFPTYAQVTFDPYTGTWAGIPPTTSTPPTGGTTTTAEPVGSGVTTANVIPGLSLSPMTIALVGAAGIAAALMFRSKAKPLSGLSRRRRRRHR